MIKVAPSILSADFMRLGQDIQSISDAGADYVHFDVMDGVFVPNISIGLPVLKSVRSCTAAVIDVHLMIEKPIKYVQRFCEAGADIVTIHVEADDYENIKEALDIIHSNGKRAGIVFKPGTSPVPYKGLIKVCDIVLIMTVEPGFGGQKFMEDQLSKIEYVRSLIDECNPSCELEVDGGINVETARKVISAGANVLVAGSYFFSKTDRKSAVDNIRTQHFLTEFNL